MKTDKRYMHSFIAVLCVAGWFTLVVSGMNFIAYELWPATIALTFLTTITAAITGAIVSVLGTLKHTKLKYSFSFNLFGTLNIIIGFSGMVFSSPEINGSPYIASASFTIGLLIYFTIYSRKTEISNHD